MNILFYRGRNLKGRSLLYAARELTEGNKTCEGNKQNGKDCMRLARNTFTRRHACESAPIENHNKEFICKDRYVSENTDYAAAVENAGS